MPTRDAMQAMRSLAHAGSYIDPVNRERDAYLRGDITVEQFEARVERVLRGEPPVALRLHRYTVPGYHGETVEVTGFRPVE